MYTLYVEQVITLKPLCRQLCSCIDILLVIELAIPFASGEKSSDIISHGIGPKPIENAKINKQTENSGKKLIFAAKVGLCFK